MGFLDRAIDFFADLDLDRLFENRPGESKGMKLAIFAAGVHVGRKPLQEILVNLPAQSRFIQIGVADATNDRTKSAGDKFMDQLA